MSKRLRQLGPLELAGVIYMMVSGGPYGLEELVGDCGYAVAVLVLLVVPLIWSLPVGLMVGELSTAMPVDGGYYVWVKRALGPFWGFQEAWLTLAASVFDMTSFLALFILYLGHLWPGAAEYGFWIGTGIVVICILWNLSGAKAVGDGSLAMIALLLAPFAALGFFAFSHGGTPLAVSFRGDEGGLLSGITIAMWNYMGWDSASTIAGEVKEPQKQYPRALLLALIAIVLSYLIPVLAVWHAGLDASEWSSGSWTTIAGKLGGSMLGAAVAIMALVSSLGIFNSLTLSLSRLPVAMAEDGFAPRFLLKRLKNGMPWAAILACGLLWISALGLSFDRLVLLDVLLYGASLVLEFVALTILRLREPDMKRPFRMPCGVAGTAIAALGPVALLACAMVKSGGDRMGGVSAFAVALMIAASGVVAYAAIRARKSFRRTAKAA